MHGSREKQGEAALQLSQDAVLPNGKCRAAVVTAGKEGDREAGRKVQALRHFTHLLQLYEHLAPGFVDGATASDLAVICGKALAADDASKPDSGEVHLPPSNLLPSRVGAQ